MNYNEFNGEENNLSQNNIEADEEIILNEEIQLPKDEVYEEYMKEEIPVSAPKRRRRKKYKFHFKTFLRSLFLTLLVAALMLVAWRAGIFAYDYISLRKNGFSSSEAAKIAWSDSVEFFVEIVDEVSPVMLTDKNVLVIGSDKQKINADVIMLVQLDAQTKSVDIISILRDTRIKIGDRYHRINASLHIGDEDFLVEQVENLMGVKIDNYVFMNYEGFRNVIDAIGGVDFYVPQDMHYSDPEQDLYINLKEGQQHLDGDKAEQLVRFRRYPMGDIARTQVQRDFVMALYKQKLNSDLIKKYKEIIPAVMDFVDTNISLQDALQYASFVSKFDVNSINTYQLPGEAKDINGVSYYIADTDAIDEMLLEIEASHKPLEEDQEPIDYQYRDDGVDENGKDIITPAQ
ncbi:MAG: LCP family protein [Clostridia bacterium]|nr:LCP family protein [Clostridia bacterium]